ncbi:Magnesium and cobalt efflux protein CorC [Stieleria maiorica]|uniref:Magnesium and cobalt efflux protein CorC n=1 Tax=Stieleria maiorica TaxID=2795974 RepID=A0A5B9MIU2_9BACT|nr:hemolysin family protein [Stieleria maiorica]QEG00370.1 Magnesium and cobalt efflux protein CorC [Stieleria maiorica]
MLALNSAITSWHAIVDYFAVDTSQVFQTDMLLRYLIQLLLLCGSAFFSGSETALFSLSHVDFQQLRQTRHRHAEKLQALLDEPRRLIVSILCGNELVNIAAVANMTGILVALYGQAKAGWISVLVMFPLLLLVGEVTPKTIAVTNPRRISAGLIAGPLWRWVRVIGPVRWLVRIISDRITTWIVGPQREASNILQIDEFRSVIEDVAETGKLNVTARTLVNNLLSAGATEIVKIMTPRTSTFFLNADLGVAEVIKQFRQKRHSRVPVYRQHRDNLIGFLHEEDVVRLHLDGADFSTLKLEDMVRPPIVVPLTKTVDEMFDFFVKSKASAAAVLNEFGGVAGFITVNDVLRSIFGSLTHRTHAPQRIIQIGPGTYECPGDTKLGELDRVTNFDLHDPRMTTIGGVAFRHIDRLPCVGDQVVVDGVAINVLEMDSHRIARVRVCRSEAAPEVPATGATE